MSDWVRVRLPWWWGWAPERPGVPVENESNGVSGADGNTDGLAPEKLRRCWAELQVWVSWFVDRYHLADEVPPCWARHPALVDELNALWHYHQEVTRPFVAMVQPDPVGPPAEPDDPNVPARAYWDWHEARWRWTQGQLRAAAGYHECLTGHRHVDEPHRRGGGTAFAEASRIIVDQLLAEDTTHEDVP